MTSARLPLSIIDLMTPSVSLCVLQACRRISGTSSSKIMIFSPVTRLLFFKYTVSILCFLLAGVPPVVVRLCRLSVLGRVGEKQSLDHLDFPLCMSHLHFCTFAQVPRRCVLQTIRRD